MLKIIISSIFIMFFQFSYAAKSTVSYGYDKDNKQIYAKIGNDKKTLFFEENYTGNPIVMFSFFNGSPSIVLSGRSIDDYTAYATLNYINDTFSIDCIYVDMKNKENGISSKKGTCGLNKKMTGDYQDLIEGFVEDNKNNININYILDGKAKTLPILISRVNDAYLYQLYKSKTDLLNDKYSIMSLSNKSGCQSYEGVIWTVDNTLNKGPTTVLKEIIKNGVVFLEDAIGNSDESSESDSCQLFQMFSVKTEKSFFYDDKNKIKKSYLVNGDLVTLLNMSQGDKWCGISYLNQANKKIVGNVLCTTLKF